MAPVSDHYILFNEDCASAFSILTIKQFVMCQKRLFFNVLRTFALIVSAHPYCARNSLRDVMPRHALSARAVEEM